MYDPRPIHLFRTHHRTPLHETDSVLSSSRIANLMFSFPLLEDLTVITGYSASADDSDDPDEAHRRRLLSLPGGVHFRRLVLGLYLEEDLLATATLIEACSHTLECLDIE